MKPSQSNLLEHSKAKVDLLGEYLKTYLQIIAHAGFTSQIHFYDLFCGEGRYDNGGEGSPLVLLRVVQHFMNTYKGVSIPKINFYFNDMDTAKIQKLEKIIETEQLHNPKWGKLHFSNQTYEAQLAGMLGAVQDLKKKKEKAFIFIDPFGYGAIRASQIKSLLCKETEILFWQPTQFMYRFTDGGTPQVLSDFLNEIVDASLWKASDSVQDLIEQIATGFEKYLGEGYFVDTFKIKKDPRTIFCLYFFTTHPQGFAKMLETKWRIDAEHGAGWDYQMQTTDLFADVKTTPQTNHLKKELTLFLKQEFRTNQEIYKFVIFKCRFLTKHANEILKEWEKAKKLDIQLRDSKARKGYFYLNDDKTQQNWIAIKLKR